MLQCTGEKKNTSVIIDVNQKKAEEFVELIARDKNSKYH